MASNPPDSKIGSEKENFESYMMQISEARKLNGNTLLATTALSTGALITAQNRLIEAGVIDEEGTPNFVLDYFDKESDQGMSVNDKLEVAEEIESKVSFIGKVWQLVEQDILSVENAEALLTKSSLVINNTLASLHSQLIDLDVGSFVGSQEQFAVQVLACSTVVLGGLAISQIPEAKEAMIRSYTEAKEDMAKLMDGRTRPTNLADVAELRIGLANDLMGFGQSLMTQQTIDGQAVIRSMVKAAAIGSYYKENIKEMASSGFATVIDYFDRALGLEKINVVEESQNNEKSDLYEPYNTPPEVSFGNSEHVDAVNRDTDEALKFDSKELENLNSTELESETSALEQVDYLESLGENQGMDNESSELDMESSSPKKDEGLEL